ncbi:SCP-like protein [Ancylostoma duodenale]|uniref:SCP-like protein n=1 Tax=Ancylostoma duodenale TaxID=51022 RepID=A0A0C2CHW1_9BILA|nr:SCP-like protein [Ancylostoma duodenale]
MTDEVRQKSLDMHNKYRSKVAKGEAKDAVSGYAPKAKKMRKMGQEDSRAILRLCIERLHQILITIYDCGLETSAMQNAKSCNYAHTNTEEFGENIWMISTNQTDKVNIAEQASQCWFSELEKYGVGEENMLTWKLWDRPNTQIGHYTQVGILIHKLLNNNDSLVIQARSDRALHSDQNIRP